MLRSETKVEKWRDRTSREAARKGRENFPRGPVAVFAGQRRMKPEPGVYPLHLEALIIQIGCVERELGEASSAKLD